MQGTVKKNYIKKERLKKVVKMTYLEEVKEDVKEYIKYEVEFNDYETIEELEEDLNERLFVNDYATGNGSGSYYCNSYKAKNKVLEEIETVVEAYKEFCELDRFAENMANEEWETMDVKTRCYLLGRAISEVMDEVEDDFNEYKETQAFEENNVGDL